MEHPSPAGICTHMQRRRADNALAVELKEQVQELWVRLQCRDSTSILALCIWLAESAQLWGFVSLKRSLGSMGWPVRMHDR